MDDDNPVTVFVAVSVTGYVPGVKYTVVGSASEEVLVLPNVQEKLLAPEEVLVKFTVSGAQPVLTSMLNAATGLCALAVLRTEKRNSMVNKYLTILIAYAFFVMVSAVKSRLYGIGFNLLY